MSVTGLHDFGLSLARLLKEDIRGTEPVFPGVPATARQDRPLVMGIT